MIKKPIITILVVLITLSALFVGLPYFSGLRAEKYFLETITAYSENPSFNFRVTDYKRNWFTSSAESVMEFNLMNKKIAVTFKHDIKHGPSLTNIGLAKVITSARLDEQTKNELYYYFKDRSPIEITIYVGFLGGQEIEFTSPPFEGHPKGKDDINIYWQGLKGKMEVSADMSRYTGKLQAPLFTISEDNGGTARIDNIEMNWDMKQKVQKLWLGNSSINIAGIDFHTDIKEPGSENVKVNIKGISIDQTSSEKDGFLSLSMVSKADSLTVMDRIFKKGIFDTEVRNLSIDAFLDLNRKMNDIAENELSQNEAGKQIFKAMTEILPNILSHSPEYIINRLSITSDEGDINSNARVKYIGEGDYKAFNPFNDLACDAMISVPKAFVREIALTITRKQMSRHFKSSGTDINEDEFEKLCQQAADKNIKGLFQMNLIVDDGDNYTSHFALKDGAITVNDQSLNIPLKR